MWRLVSGLCCLSLVQHCNSHLEVETSGVEEHVGICGANAAGAMQAVVTSSLVQKAGYVSRSIALTENPEAHSLLASVVTGHESRTTAGSISSATADESAGNTSNATTIVSIGNASNGTTIVSVGNASNETIIVSIGNASNETANATSGLAPAPTPAADTYGIVGDSPSTTTTQASASGALSYLTQHGCHCKSAWSVEDEIFYGCTDLQFSSEIVRGCVVEEGAQECPLALPFGEATVLFDGCTILQSKSVEEQLARLQAATAPQCHCQPQWEYNKTTYQNCAFTPDTDQPWCYIIEDETLCPYVAGVGLGNQRWRYCEEYLTDIIVPIVVPVDILKGNAGSSFRSVAALLLTVLTSFFFHLCHAL